MSLASQDFYRRPTMHPLWARKSDVVATSGSALKKKFCRHAKSLTGWCDANSVFAINSISAFCHRAGRGLSNHVQHCFRCTRPANGATREIAAPKNSDASQSVAYRHNRARSIDQRLSAPTRFHVSFSPRHFGQPIFFNLWYFEFELNVVRRAIAAVSGSLIGALYHRCAHTGDRCKVLTNEWW